MWGAVSLSASTHLGCFVYPMYQCCSATVCTPTTLPRVGGGLIGVREYASGDGVGIVQGGGGYVCFSKINNTRDTLKKQRTLGWVKIYFPLACMICARRYVCLQPSHSCIFLL
jgi:hypothetical protein